jgi:hypothetical protein
MTVSVWEPITMLNINFFHDPTADSSAASTSSFATFSVTDIMIGSMVAMKNTCKQAKKARAWRIVELEFEWSGRANFQCSII